MVRPLPEAFALLACEVADFALAERLLAGLVRLPVRPVAIELSVCGAAVPAAKAGETPAPQTIVGPPAEGNVARLCVGFEGSSVEVEWMLAKLNEEWTAAGVASSPLSFKSRDDTPWCWMAEFPADETINVLPGKLVETVAEVLKDSPDCAIQAHAGNGIIRISRTNGNDRLAAASTQREGGEDVLVSPEIRVMQAIKERFDPKNILNPGLLAAMRQTEMSAPPDTLLHRFA
jgi:FAD/FMN-containing dehydrogenase